MTSKPKYDLDGIFDPDLTNPHDAHSILMRLVPANAKVLELGCSSGYLSGYLEKKKGCEVTGLEVDPIASQIAVTRCHACHVVDLDEPDALNVVTDTFDVLLAPAILEHLKHPERILKTAKKRLNPGATVIISLPNIAHYTSRLRLLSGKFNYTDYGLMDRTHVHFYTVETGRALLENCGYRIETLYACGSGLQNILEDLAHRFHRTLSRPILPGALAYEIIYLASVPVL